MNTFVTHPSVRIKGTENNYEPVPCLDATCAAKNLLPHMHCPFCVKTEAFHDAVILRAHYRVKHVDKGIEFAGLKVLRCCDHCDIVGTIKGVKEFKGAHWHCYKCKNGFNRRDEAIKHYRTHFRNPQTTFQIQVAHEVNQNLLLGGKAETTTETISQDLTSIHPALTEAVMTTSAETGLISSTSSTETNLSNGRSDEYTVSVAANETVGTSDGQTLMIIHEDQIVQGTLANSNNTVQIADMAQPEILTTENFDLGTLLEDRAELQKQVARLTSRVEELEQQAAKEQEAKVNLTEEVSQLKMALQVQISNGQRREQELLNQLSVPLDDRIMELLGQLKVSHEDLLHQHLAQLRRTYIQAATSMSSVSEQPMFILSAGDQGGGVIEMASSDSSAAIQTTPTMIGTIDGTTQLVIVSGASGIQTTTQPTDTKPEPGRNTQADDITTTTTITENDDVIQSSADGSIVDNVVYSDNVISQPVADTDSASDNVISVEEGEVLPNTENPDISSEGIVMDVTVEDTTSNVMNDDAAIEDTPPEGTVTVELSGDIDGGDQIIMDVKGEGDQIEVSSPRAKRKRTN